MELFHNLASGFSFSLSPLNILYCFIGVALGTAVGVLPGLGPIATMSMLLPITFRMDMTSAIIMLSGIYYGTMYGGSITSILVNVPGETATIVTCLDGYQMSKKGRAGAALGIAAFGSFIAGTLTTIGLTIIAAPMAKVALKFGPPEMAILVVLGLTLVTYLSSKSRSKALMMAILGLILSCVGLDPIYGIERFTYGSQTLIEGFSIAIMAMGLFGIAEVIAITQTESSSSDYIKQPTNLRNLLPNLQDWKDSAGPITRGTLIGFLLGMLPGGGGVIASFTSYVLEKRISRYPEKFGTGAIEGVAGPESANNAGAQSAFIPLLILGIPSNAVLAIILGALMIHGVAPGPMLYKEHTQMFWSVITSMYIGNVMLIILNVPLIAIFVGILRIRRSILSVLIIFFCFIGAYSLNNNYIDVIILVIFGIIGYLIRIADLDPAPLLLAFVLGKILEKSIRQSLLIGQGSALVFVTRPISALFLIITITLLIIPVIRTLWRRLQSN